MVSAKEKSRKRRREKNPCHEVADCVVKKSGGGCALKMEENGGKPLAQ